MVRIVHLVFYKLVMVLKSCLIVCIQKMSCLILDILQHNLKKMQIIVFHN